MHPGMRLTKLAGRLSRFGEMSRTENVCVVDAKTTRIGSYLPAALSLFPQMLNLQFDNIAMLKIARRLHA